MYISPLHANELAFWKHVHKSNFFVKKVNLGTQLAPLAI